MVSYARRIGARDSSPSNSPSNNQWGSFPTLTLVSAFGLLIVATGDYGARTDSWWSSLLFWVGLLLVFIPVTGRLFNRGLTERERIGLVVLVGLALYVVKVLHSPTQFTFSDEFSHLRTLQDIAGTGTLFNGNPLLAPSPSYPGLEMATFALSSLTGLSAFHSGLLMVAFVRLVLMLALYLTYERLSGSSRAAGIAALIYAVNPNFVFFDAQFSYESLSLAFLALLLFVTVRRSSVQGIARVGLNLSAILAVGAIVVTHHLTTYAMVIALALWAIIAIVMDKNIHLGDTLVALFRRYTGEETAVSSSQPLWQRILQAKHIFLGKPSAPGTLVFLALVLSFSWLVFAAAQTAHYLSSPFGSAITQFVRLVTGEQASRELFRTFTGQSSPIWEQIVSYGSVILVLIALPFGLWQLRLLRSNACALMLGLCTVAYPISLAIRLTTYGAEISNRSSEFLFLGLAFVLGLGFAAIKSKSRNWSGMFIVWATFAFMGGVIIGFAPWARMPGSYLVAADTRSVEPQGIAAAEWMRSTLGADHRIATDRTNRLDMAVYGEQYPVSIYDDNIDVSSIFFSATVGIDERDLLQQGKVHYLVVDKRLSTNLPLLGVYFEQGEPDTFKHTTPMQLSALTKFDFVKDISRLFDSGDIVIYDVAGITHAK